jgi:hypothetical protein
VPSVFTVDNDTQITTTLPDRVVSASTTCDVVVSNPIGKSVSNSGDVFTYTPQNRNSTCNNGGQSCPPTNPTPSTPTKADATIFVAIVGTGGVVILSVALAIRQKRGRQAPLTA